MMKKILLSLAAAVLCMALLPGCEARPLARDSLSEAMRALNQADAERISAFFTDPGVLLEYPDKQRYGRECASIAEEVYNSMTYEVTDQRGTYDVTNMTITVTNKDLAPVMEAFAKKVDASAEPLSKDERKELFLTLYEDSKATLSQSFTLTLNFNVKADHWQAAMPEGFAETVTGGYGAIAGQLAEYFAG